MTIGPPTEYTLFAVVAKALSSLTPEELEKIRHVPDIGQIHIYAGEKPETPPTLPVTEHFLDSLSEYVNEADDPVLTAAVDALQKIADGEGGTILAASAMVMLDDMVERLRASSR